MAEVKSRVYSQNELTYKINQKVECFLRSAPTINK